MKGFTPQSVKLFVVSAFAVFSAIIFINCAGKPSEPVTISDEPDAITPVLAKNSGTSNEYAKFSHSVKEHADVNCNSCHVRTNKSLTPKLSGHASCLDCHLEQFVTENTQMCVICHKDVKSADAPVKAFPVTFEEQFRMTFDHAAHERGGARPAEGCAFCHKPASGASLSIPVGINAHNQCFSCHTPELKVGKKNLGSCATCHELGGYTRASTFGAAFKTSFTHDNHRGLDCARCHDVRSGVAQTQQVSSPVAEMHHPKSSGTNCASCHNDVVAFGESNFANCRRCHLGQSFSQIPASR